jgi:putative oxidoreductase
MLKKLFAPGNNSGAASLGLLVLRLWIGFSMLVNHGVEKLGHFSDTAPHFPDPLGIGHTASLALAVFAEFFASLLLIFGLVTRWSALVLAINMAVAFIAVHKGALSGQGSGELAFLYLMGYVTLLLAGPGSFSLDRMVFGKGGSERSK